MASPRDVPFDEFSGPGFRVLKLVAAINDDEFRLRQRPGKRLCWNDRLTQHELTDPSQFI
jgi:hypothetical protein